MIPMILSHLPLTSPAHQASTPPHWRPPSARSNPVPRASPLLVEVIPDYRATVVKCLYNVFFQSLSPPSLCLDSCPLTAGRLQMQLQHDSSAFIRGINVSFQLNKQNTFLIWQWEGTRGHLGRVVCGMFKRVSPLTMVFALFYGKYVCACMHM